MKGTSRAIEMRLKWKARERRERKKGQKTNKKLKLENRKTAES